MPSAHCRLRFEIKKACQIIFSQCGENMKIFTQTGASSDISQLAFVCVITNNNHYYGYDMAHGITEGRKRDAIRRYIIEIMDLAIWRLIILINVLMSP